MTGNWNYPTPIRFGAGRISELAEACAQRNRYEFMLTVNPLRVVGGTGSPVNPIAIL